MRRTATVPPTTSPSLWSKWGLAGGGALPIGGRRKQQEAAMAKLILHCEDSVAQEYAVEKMVTIGRLSDNTVVLDHPSVSSHHACVFSDGEHCIVEDLQSTNGTFVNGRRVARRTLLNGDVVLVGKHKIVFDQLAS